jgi:vitamin B12 transporter
VGASGGSDRAWYHLGVSGVETDGFDACSGDPITFRGCGADEPDADGYRRSSGTLRAGYLLPGGVEVEAHALRAEGENHFDGFFNASDTVQQVIGAKAAFTTLSDWRISLKAGRSRDELDSFSDGVFQERFDTERDSLTLQGDYRPGTGNVVTLGVDYQEDRVDTTQVTRESARDNRAVFGQYLGRWGEHSLQAALRHDDNEQFGSHTTGSLAWGFAIRPGWEISASYGTAFKAPTFLDLYFVNFGGNPDLEPERSRTAELGLRGSLPWGSLQINAFATEIDDLITFDNRSFTPVNLEKARIRGVEADVDTTLAGWDMDVALTLLNPEDRSPGSACDLLLRRPEQTLRVDASRGLGRYRIGATVLAEGRRFDLGCERVGGYATLDLRAEVQLAPGWHLQGKLANMLDKDYETLDFYNEPGRTFLVTLRYAPGA